MLTLCIALGSFFGFILAYHTYGKWLGQKIFRLDERAPVPSHQLRDDVDFIPTRKEIIFGHHFTSIAGTGPIVGPAIAVFWGWLPALVWVVFGAIFIGAVHDFGALVVSLRNRGQTVGEIAGRLITPRAKLLFLIVLFFSLMIVIGIFGLVIAVIFREYPESVLSVWIEIPIALAIGFFIVRKGKGLMIPSLLALAAMYGCIVIGTYVWPITVQPFEITFLSETPFVVTPIIQWTAVLLVYCYIASVLPVWLLLQPRDYINSHQLMLALALLVGGLVFAGITNQTDLSASAPAIAENIPADAPPIWPFLFITIACGACSGFHCLVSSGTSSKQLACEPDARYVAYGSMLLEGALAVIVILCCCAGLGMGLADENSPDAAPLVGRAAWESRYQAEITPLLDADGNPVIVNGVAKTTGGWANHGLPKKVGAFVEGGANFIASIGIPRRLAIAIIAVLVASFAATTLDTATRLQRYVIQELGASLHIKPLQGKFTATGVAVVTGGAVAMTPGPGGPGTGGMVLWPLFGATNQLLAGLAFLVLVFYLARRKLPYGFAAGPMAIMLLLPGWAMAYQIYYDFWPNEKWILLGFGIGVLVLQTWMIAEAAIMWPKAKGVLEELLPPLEDKKEASEAAVEGGRSC